MRHVIRARDAVRAVVVAAAVLVTMIAGTASPASATVLPGYHQLMNRQSSECLDVEFASPVPGDEVKIWRCVDAPNQHWRPTGGIPGYGVQLQVEHTGMCLTYRGLPPLGDPLQGTDVVQSPCDTGNPLSQGVRRDQLWQVQPFADGWSRIRTSATTHGGESLCLDKAWGDVTVWHCHDGRWQQWQSLG